MSSPMSGSDLLIDPPEHERSPMTGSDLEIDPPERTAASPSGSAPNVGPIDHVVTSDTIIDSIRTRLLTRPGDTTVRTGHGDSTSVGAEAPHLDEFIARGH